MPDDLTTKDAIDLALKAQDLRLKAWEAFIERAYKILALGLAGNLGAAVFATPILRDEKSSQTTTFDIALEAMPRFAEGATFAILGLGILWLFSCWIQHGILSQITTELKSQLQAKQKGFNFPRAWTTGAVAAVFGAAFWMVYEFWGGLEVLLGAGFGFGFNLQPH